MTSVSLASRLYCNTADFKVLQFPPRSGYEIYHVTAIATYVRTKKKKKSAKYEGKKKIKVWLKLSSKRLSTGGTDPQAKRTRTESHLEKMEELQGIVVKLKEKHKDGKYSHFSKAQFHCWGNTIQLGHHDSYDDPPNKPFFGCPKNATLTASSPGKRIRLRSKCIDQLTKWHKLMEAGVISDAMGDIKKF